MRLAEIEGLRRALIAEETAPTGVPEPAATVDQLFEIDRRYGAAGGDRWFVAPAEGEPLLLLPPAQRRADRPGRGRRHPRRLAANAATPRRSCTAAVAAAQAAGDAPIFLTAEAADWPQLMYAKLGFETVGDLTILAAAGSPDACSTYGTSPPRQRLYGRYKAGR